MLRLLLALELDIDTEGSYLLNQHIEGLGHTRLHSMITIDNVLVHLGPSGHVVRLDRQHFLQGLGGTVTFQCPDLHLTETLATKLRLAAQRLLRNQAVGTG